MEEPPRHPLGRRAQVLLTSVFGPFGRDDAYGSRSVNPMELYHNQVTRVQGPFSLRMFHRSWGLMMIQANLEAPCTVLDFPTLDRFVEELTQIPYDIIGIGSIIPNVAKVEHMCRLVREHRPGATLVVGGHIAAMPGIRERLQADHVVPGEGVRWFRSFLGEDPERPLRHPQIASGLGTRALGITLKEQPVDVAATLIPSVGCPVGCNFCCTSSLFGGKGRSIDFFPGGDALFELMVALEASMGVCSFFVMDENFLLNRKRALRLLELMEHHGKAWSLYVFSSARALRAYSMEELVGLGISWVWMGLEGKDSRYAKLEGVDTFALVRELQAHGICVLGSSIIGLEDHTPERMDEVIEHAVRHATEFHQFMLYTPGPGTPFWAQMEAEGRLLPRGSYEDADIHGQRSLNYRHWHLPPGQETEWLLQAFQRDFEAHGPSVLRMPATRLKGWLRHKDHPSERVRRRIRFEAASLPTIQAGALWAGIRWFSGNIEVRTQLEATLRGIRQAFGLQPRLAAPLIGRYIFSRLRAEERRLQQGLVREPPTFYERNPAAQACSADRRPATLCRWVELGRT